MEPRKRPGRPKKVGGSLSRATKYRRSLPDPVPQPQPVPRHESSLSSDEEIPISGSVENEEDFLAVSEPVCLDFEWERSLDFQPLSADVHLDATDQSLLFSLLVP